MDIAAAEASTDSPRSRVEAALSGHLRSVGPLLAERGLATRAGLGLWHASMGSLLEGIGAEAAAKLIAHRSKTIRGHGDNADAASSDLTPETEAQVLEEVAAAASELVEAIGDAYEDALDDGLEHLFGEVLVDVLAKTLIDIWGPFHTRKAFGDQWVAFSAGREVVVHPSEPDELVRARRREPPKEIRRDEVAPSPLARSAAERHIDMRVEAEVEGVAGAYAVAMETSERGDRGERRDIFGPSSEGSVRKAVLAAAVEGLRAVAETAGSAVVRVASSAAFLSSGMAPPERRSATARLGSEEAMWKLLDSFADLQRIEWRHVAGGLSDDLAERCDRLIRRQLAV